MNGMKTEEAGSRKKYLAPLVVIMLCLVALTGAAYAYQSSLEVQDNTVDADYLSIDLANGNPAQDITTPGANPGAIVFTDYHVYSTAMKNTVKADITTKLVKTYALKVSTDTTFNTVKVSSGDIATMLAKTIGDKTVSQLFKIYVGTSADGTGMQELTDAGYEFSVTQTGDSTSVSIYMFVVAMDGATAKTTLNTTVSTVVKAQYEIPSPDTNNAKALATLLNGDGYKFTVTFDAYKKA